MIIGVIGGLAFVAIGDGLGTMSDVGPEGSHYPVARVEAGAADNAVRREADDDAREIGSVARRARLTEAGGAGASAFEASDAKAFGRAGSGAHELEEVAGAAATSRLFGSDKELIVLEDLWRNQPVDTGWKAEKEHYVASAITDAQLPADRLVDVDCRTTVCRVRLHLPDVAEAAVLKEFRVPDAEMRVFPDPNGSHKYNVFITRPGNELAPTD